jgi:carnitine 3-dehydrogenase
VTTRLLGFDDKRLHLFHELHRSGDDVLLATAEQMLLHVDTTAGRAHPARPEIRARIAELAAAHAGLPKPERAGRAIAAPAYTNRE